MSPKPNEGKRPHGFLRFRYWESRTQVPELVLNPAAIARCYDESVSSRLRVALVLTDGQKLVLFQPESFEAVLADIDTAMRERCAPEVGESR